MSGFDLDKALRWAKQTRRTIARRADRDLPYFSEIEIGGPLLLDTCVYIDQMQGRLNGDVAAFVLARQINHSTVAVQELLHAVGRLDPTHPDSDVAQRQIVAAVRAMPAHRLHAPTTETLARAAILSGALSRWQGYAKDDRFRALHDSVLYLQALRLGFTVLTRNVADFDLLLQLLPAGRAAFYRRGS